MRRRDLWLGLLVFAAIVSLGHLRHGSIDAIQRLALTRALVLHGSVVTERYGPIKYAPLQSLVMIPPYAAGYLAGKWLGGDAASAEHLAYRLCAVLYGPVTTSLICVVFFELVTALGIPPAPAVASTYLLLFGTLLLPYSRIMFSEPLSALLMLSSCALLATGRGRGRALASFLCLGVLCLNGLVFAPLYLLALIHSVAVGGRRRETLVTAALALTVLAAVLTAWAMYDHARYASVFVSGYEGETFTASLPRGLYALTLSVGRGIVIYSPLTVLGTAWLVLQHHRIEPPARNALMLYVGAAALYLLIYSAWRYYYAGWVWGPRFLVPFVPVLHVGVAFVLARRAALNRTTRALLAALVAGAIAINAYEFLGVYVGYEARAFGAITEEAPYLQSLFDPASSAIFHNWDRGAFAERFPQFAVVAAGLWLLLTLFRRHALGRSAP